jgi:hypothetical protein
MSHLRRQGAGPRTRGPTFFRRTSGHRFRISGSVVLRRVRVQGRQAQDVVHPRRTCPRAVGHVPVEHRVGGRKARQLHVETEKVEHWTDVSCLLHKVHQNSEQVCESY